MPDFGDPSLSLVPVAVWLVRDEHGWWPSWGDAIETLALLLGVDPGEAERRLLASIATGEVRARFDDGEWLITIDEETADAIARRYLDTALGRKENHDGHTA